MDVDGSGWGLLLKPQFRAPRGGDQVSGDGDTDWAGSAVEQRVLAGYPKVAEQAEARLTLTLGVDMDRCGKAHREALEGVASGHVSRPDLLEQVDVGAIWGVDAVDEGIRGLSQDQASDPTLLTECRVWKGQEGALEGGGAKTLRIHGVGRAHARREEHHSQESHAMPRGNRQQGEDGEDHGRCRAGLAAATSGECSTGEPMGRIVVRQGVRAVGPSGSMASMTPFPSVSGPQSSPEKLCCVPSTVGVGVGIARVGLTGRLDLVGNPISVRVRGGGARVGVAHIELVSVGDVVTVVVCAGVELHRIVQVVGDSIAVFVPVLVGTAGIARVRPERQLIRIAQAISIRVVLGNTGITATRFFVRVGDAVSIQVIAGRQDLGVGPVRDPVAVVIRVGVWTGGVTRVVAERQLHRRLDAVEVVVGLCHAGVSTAFTLRRVAETVTVGVAVRIKRGVRVHLVGEAVAVDINGRIRVDGVEWVGAVYRDLVAVAQSVAIGIGIDGGCPSHEPPLRR